MHKLKYIIGLIISGLYLSNISAGFIEFIPDNIPGLGNLDEAFFAGMLFYCLRGLGITLPLPGKTKDDLRDATPKGKK